MLIKRESLFHRDVSYEQWIDSFERWVLASNTLRGWLKSVLAPTREL
jgi:hypothetical protein